MDNLRRSWTRDLDLAVNPWWILWVAAISVAWLLPTHMLPWRSYHAEMAMVLAVIPAALWAPLYRRAPVTLTAGALVVLLAASIPFAQLAAGILEFAGDAWITAAYLFAFGLAIVTGTRIEQVEPGRTADALFAAFVVAAVLSTGLVLYQLLGLSGLGLLTVSFPQAMGYRPFANLGQSNHLATLLVWGLIAFWRLYVSGRTRGWIAVGAAAFLLVGIAATQSRTAWLQMGVLGAAALVWRTSLASRRAWPGLLLLGLGFVALVLGWGAVKELIGFHGARSLGDELSSAGLRPAAWRLFADAVARHPWTGWGWNQIAVAQGVLALDWPSLRYTFDSGHNLLLDLVVQNGIPITIALVVALALWSVAKLRRVTTPTGRLLLLAIAVLLVHAMVEFPQNYTYFLLPVGLMIGVLDAAHPAGPAVRVHRLVAVSLVIAGAATAAWIGVEYRLAERSLEQVRFERNRVGFSRNSRAPDLLMLTQLRDYLRFLRVRYTAPLGTEELEWMRRVVAHYPSDGNQLALAVAAASNGRPDVASEALARMCRMVPPSRCDQALTSWRAMTNSSPALAAVSLPTVALPH
jgi:O-antigen ligase